MLDVKRLLVLRAVADSGTVAAAARTLNLTPQAVSQQLAVLGRELGVELTRPRGRGIELTDAARTVLNHTEVLLAQLGKLDADLDSSRTIPRHSERLTIGSFSTALSALALPAIAAVRVRHLAVAFSATQTLPPYSLDSLAGGSTDVVLTADTDAAPFADPRFVRHEIGRDHFSVAVGRDHPMLGARTSDTASAQIAVALSELHDEDWIFAATDLCQGVGQAACRSAGFVPRRMHDFDDWESTLRAVALGLGVALVPTLARTRLLAMGAGDTFVVLPLTETRPSRRIFALTRRGADSPALRDLIDAIQDAASTELAE